MTLAIGLAMGLAPAPVAVMVGVVVAALAWWNPRPAIVVLTWPLAYAVANTSSLLVWTSSRDQLEWRYLIPLVASVPFALFLRHCATRVHRLR